MKRLYAHAAAILSILIIGTSCIHKKEITTEKIPYNGRLVDVSHRPLRYDSPISKLAFGSCNRTDLPQVLWDDVLDAAPDVWIWLGDNIYADTDDPEKLTQMYNDQLLNEQYQKLCTETMILGTWDDHDYGSNDGGKEWKGKETNKAFLLEFLNIPPENPVYRHKGIYQSYVFGPAGRRVKIILLDSRSFRDPLKGRAGSYGKNMEGTILGSDQWKWLEKQLTQSDADVHIIANGIQFLPKEHGYEKWANFPTERTRLLDMIVALDVSNPVLLSGDRHSSELSKINWKGKSIWEVTSSGLTHAHGKPKDEPNTYRQGRLVTDLSFGLIQVQWTAEEPVISLSLEGNGNTQLKIDAQ